MSVDLELSLFVERVEPVTPTIRGLVLRPAPGTVLSPYVAGSHVVLQCGETRNAYSLTGSGVRPQAYTVSVLHQPDGRGGSRFVHALASGETIRCSRPRGAFPPVASARHHLMIAGGIGITPFLSHLRAGAVWKRSATLIFGVGGSGPVPYREELEALATGGVHVARDRTALGRAIEAALPSQPLGTHLYVCGPGPLIEDVLDRARQHGWPDERCHAERFGALDLDEGLPFTVRLGRSGRTFDVPAGTSLLDGLAAAGIAWPALCRQGVCGECRMEGVQGALLHRDLYLSPAERAEGTCLMPCVSRADGVLTLDL